MRQLWQTGWMHNRVRMIVGLVPGEGSAASPGNAARNGSGILWSTPTWRRTPATGNGSPAAAPMRRRSSASSIRCCRARSSTPRVSMCGTWVPELAKLPDESHPSTVDRLRRSKLTAAGVSAGPDLSATHRGSCQGATRGARRLSADLRLGLRAGGWPFLFGDSSALGFRGPHQPTTPMRKNA